MKRSQTKSKKFAGVYRDAPDELTKIIMIKTVDDKNINIQLRTIVNPNYI